MIYWKAVSDEGLSKYFAARGLSVFVFVEALQDRIS